LHDAGWSSPVARQAHNLKVVGSNPTPATNDYYSRISGYPHFFVIKIALTKKDAFMNAMNPRKILVMGLPGAGKTTLSKSLAPLLNAVHFNADAVRANINRDLGFSPADRVEQARRMGWLCDRVAEAGCYAIADFVCPTPEARDAFGDAIIIWVDRIKEGRYEDTNRLFVPPEDCDFRITDIGTPDYWANKIYQALRGEISSKKATA
jgi:adenylylsulfate kinase